MTKWKDRHGPALLAMTKGGVLATTKPPRSGEFPSPPAGCTARGDMNSVVTESDP
jgi:hypothetical protein